MINNIFTFLILIILPVAFIIMLTIAWLNKGSEQSYNLLWPIIGGAVAAVFFFAKTFYTPLPTINQNVNILLLTSEKEIIPLSLKIADKVLFKPSDGYDHICSEFLSYKHNNKNLEKKDHNISYFDLIEWSTLTWISRQYPGHWQIQRNWFDGISGGGGSISRAVNAEKEVEEITIFNLLQENQFAKEFKRKHGDNIFLYLPSCTEAKYNKISPEYSTLELLNRNIVIKITFEGVGGGVLGASALGEKISKKVHSGYTKHFMINISVKPLRMRRFSMRTQTQIDWAKELMQFYYDSFSWDILKNNLEKHI